MLACMVDGASGHTEMIRTGCYDAGYEDPISFLQSSAVSHSESDPDHSYYRTVITTDASFREIAGESITSGRGYGCRRA